MHTLLKFTLAPALVVLASLAGRRWGLKVTGWLASFPVVAGPILFLYALEQGPAFAARAARQTLMGLLGFSAFALIYAWCARKTGIASSLAAGWAAFLILSLAAEFLHPAWPIALGLALAALLGARALLPSHDAPDISAAPLPVWDLPLRALATAVLVAALTAAAKSLGPDLSGVLTPFPVASSVLAGFAQRRQGPAGAATVLSGLLLGCVSLAGFCAALSLGLTWWSVPQAFAFGLTVSMAVQLAVLRML